METVSKSSSPVKLIIIGGIILFIVIGIIAVIAMLMQDEGESERKAFQDATCNVEDPSPIEINMCSMVTHCTFDNKICEFECPFDYRKDDNGCQTSCECAENGQYQGDIRYDISQINSMAKEYGYLDEKEDFDLFYGSVTTSTHLWTDDVVDGINRIPYTLHDNIKASRRKMQIIEETFEYFTKMLCIEFVPRTTEKDYALIVSGEGCTSFLGNAKNGEQKVSLDDGCDYFVIALHEFQHLLGWAHEHTRADRDGYIEIFKENILEGMYANNFMKKVKDDVLIANTMYDLKSRVQYGSSSLAKGRGLDTFLIRGTHERVLRDNHSPYSESDLFEIRNAYNCLKPVTDASWSEWGEWSACDATCGKGELYRYRKCENKNKELVIECPGGYFEKQDCSEGGECPYSWLPWEGWSHCYEKCGPEIRGNFRKCTGAEECLGKSFIVEDCGHPPCDESGKPAGGSTNVGGDSSGKDDRMTETSWGEWSSCSASCDGERKREKSCGNSLCSGSNSEREVCNTGICYEGDVLGEWGEWGSCTAECNQKRKRRCHGVDRKPVDKCGANAPEFEFEEKLCDSYNCRNQGGQWGEWSACSASCEGTRMRNKMCNGRVCPGESPEGEMCNVGVCEDTLGIWSSWSSCSHLCSQERKRKCRHLNNEVSTLCGYNAQEYEYDKRSCNTKNCETESSSSVGEWGFWSSCSRSCDGTRTRKQECQQSFCPNQKEQSEQCNVGVCTGEDDSDGTDENNSIFEMRELKISNTLCGSSSNIKWYFGDFNGDRRTDALCITLGGSLSLGHANTVGNVEKLHWKGTARSCSGENIYIADFNGDGKDDVLCKDEMKRRLVLLYANSVGVLSEKEVDAGNFCTDPSDNLVLINMPNSKTMDLLCHFEDKHIEVRSNIGG
uniref:uncharacterized protein LOC120345409 n=1 Tax=Styela clava TaxID=7725 RepID=UPI00193A688D|nr:uncharacterized protein LOC120345409 [Styela clava]